MPKLSNLTVESDIGQFGLQNAEKVIAFLKTKTAEKLRAEIEKYLAEKKEMEQSMALDNLSRERKKEAILQEALAEEEEGKEIFMKSIAVDNLPQQPPKESNASEAPDEQMTKKKSVIDAALKSALEDIEKTEETYSNYNENIDEAENFIKTLDSKDPLNQLGMLEDRINELKEEIEEQSSEMSKPVGAEEESKTREMLAALTAKNLQIAALKDMQDVVKGKKNMFDKAGNPTTTFQEALFIVPKDQKLHKEGENFYLLDADEEFTELSSEEQEAKKQQFEEIKQQISSVREVVAHNRGLDLGEKIKEVGRIGSQIVEFLLEKASQKSSSAPQFTGMAATTSSSKVNFEKSNNKNVDQPSQDSNTAKPAEDSPTTKIR